MSDRLFFTLAGVFAVLTIALAMVAPQGLGARSVSPFRRPLGPVDPEITALAAAKAREKALHPPRPSRPPHPVKEAAPADARSAPPGAGRVASPPPAAPRSLPTPTPPTPIGAPRR